MEQEMVKSSQTKSLHPHCFPGLADLPLHFVSMKASPLPECLTQPPPPQRRAQRPVGNSMS